MTSSPQSGRIEGFAGRRWMGGLVAATLAAATGCGHSDSLPSYQVYEVKGQVLLANGKPLDTGRRLLRAQGRPAPDPQRRDRPRRHLLHGHRRIRRGGAGRRIQAPDRGDPDQSPKNRKPIIPPKYADEDSSGLVVSVRAEPNHLDPIRLR